MDEVLDLDKSERFSNDLEAALAKFDVDIAKNFWYNSILQSAPNPCLSIKGIGTVGLPLSTRDAEAIKSHFTCLPEHAQVWELAHSGAITYHNPEWEAWVTQVASSCISDLKLGSSGMTAACRLQKIVLNGPGSRVLTHEELHVEGPSILATLAIILPSHHEGGKIRLTFGGVGGISAMIDTSTSSTVKTQVVAWDQSKVTHQTDPIESGYRLSVIVKLVCAGTPLRREDALGRPDTSAASTHLCTALQAWSAAKPLGKDKQPICVVYLLQSDYEESDLAAGWNALKGTDAAKVMYLLPLAREFGLIVRLSTLKMIKVNCGDENVSKNAIRLDSIFDTKGNLIAKAKSGTVSHIIPRVSAQHMISTENGAVSGQGPTAICSQKTAFLIYELEEEEMVMIQHGALVSWQLEKLKARGAPPSQSDRDLAAKIIDADWNNDTETWLTSVLPQLLDLATSWADGAMWKKVVGKMRTSALAVGGKRIAIALQKLPFEAVKEWLETVVEEASSTGGLDDCINFLRSIDHPVRQPWIQVQAVSLLGRHIKSRSIAPPQLILLSKMAGLKDLMKSEMWSCMAGEHIPTSYHFWISFADALFKNRGAFVGEEATPLLNGVLRNCLDSAAAQVIDPRERFPNLPLILEIIDKGLKFDAGYRYNVLLAHVLKDSVKSTPQEILDQYSYVYTPFILNLKVILKRHGKGLEFPPFGNVIRTLTKYLLTNYLGNKPQASEIAPQKAGCGEPTCFDCQQLDAFLMDGSLAQTVFKVVEKRRKHVEQHLYPVSNVCTFETIRDHGSPYSLVVRKAKALAEVALWPKRVRDVKTFLIAIGDHNDLEALFGKEGCRAILDFLAGLRAFEPASLLPAAAQTGISSTGATPRIRPGLRKAMEQFSAKNASSPAVGTKRTSDALEE